MASRPQEQATLFGEHYESFLQVVAFLQACTESTEPPGMRKPLIKAFRSATSSTEIARISTPQPSFD